jgi:hypothetical protein
MEKQVTIKIQGEGITFEDTISKALVPQIISLCMATQKKDENPLEGFFFKSPSEVKKAIPEGVVEYTKRHNAKSNFEKILSFAGYIKDIQSKEIFYSNEIKSLFRDAREILPANFTRDFNTVIGNGWIHKDNENPDAYYITQTGLNALESGFTEGISKKIKKLSKKDKDTK